MTTARVIALLVGLTAGCVRRYEVVAHEVYEQESANRTSAMREAVRARGLTVFDVTTAVALLPEELERCGSEPPAPRPITLSLPPRAVTVDACALREFLTSDGKVLGAHNPDGSAVTLVRASDLDTNASSDGHAEHYVPARTANGRFALLRPRRVVKETRKAHRDGTCNRMPSPGGWNGATVSLFLFDKDPPDTVELIDVSYSGVEIQVSCDSVVE